MCKPFPSPSSKATEMHNFLPHSTSTTPLPATSEMRTTPLRTTRSLHLPTPTKAPRGLTALSPTHHTPSHHQPARWTELSVPPTTTPRTTRSLFLIAALTLLLLTPLTQAQTAAPATLTPQPESFPVSSGDLLDVKVFNTPELSAQARVNGKGEILLPVTGAVTVAGLTPDQINVAVEKALHDRQIMAEPHVTVMVTEYSTQMVTVTGEVKNPGVYSLVGRHDLYYVLSAAGGPTANQGDSITITHKQDADNPQTIPVNSANYSSLQQKTVILPGDTIIVSRAPVYYVVGDVGKSGAFYIQNGQTVSVLNAIAMAQSANYTASTAHISLIRKANNKTDVIPLNLKQISTAKEPDVALQDGDILFVPGSAWKRIGQSMIPGLATTLAGTATTAGVLH